MAIGVRGRETAFFRRMTLPEEDRRQYVQPSSWTGCWRWFRSTNVVDLYRYRSQAEKDRIRRVLFGMQW